MLRKLSLLVLVALVLLGGIPGAQADDVPDSVRKWYDKAQTLYAKGDLKKALSALSKGKSKNPDSVDFWDLYVRVWRGLGKKETTLWDKIIAKAEKKIPGTMAFDMLRVRLAETAEERMTFLKAAIEKNPDAVEPRLLLAREHLKDGDDVTAEEILDAILEKQPGNEAALVTKGDLMIESGRSRSAMKYAEEALGEHDLPGLHDLMARALLLVSENDASKLEEAKAEAEKAVAARPDPRFVVTLASCLDRGGKLDEALKVLRDGLAKGNAPAIAAKLGEFDLRKGNYEKAIEGLGIVANPTYRVARALAHCHAKLGNQKMFDALAPKVQALAEDEDDARIWVCSRQIYLGDIAGALKTLDGLEGDTAEWCRCAAHSWNGDVEATKALAGTKAKGGNRGNEEWLLPLARALVLQKLGGKAASAGATIRAALVAAAKADVERAKPPTAATDETPDANSVGFMQRYVSCRRTIGNRWFTPTSQVSLSINPEDGVIAIALVAQAECPFEAQRTIAFNSVKIEGEGNQESIQAALQGLMPKLQSMAQGEGAQAWAGAVKNFKEASGAFVDGDWAKAIEGFGAALGAEPGWGRARLFLAAATALNGDAGGAAKEAAAAAKNLPDDWDGRELGILIQALGGQDGSAETKALAERQESYEPRRMGQL